MRKILITAMLPFALLCALIDVFIFQTPVLVLLGGICVFFYSIKLAFFSKDNNQIKRILVFGLLSISFEVVICAISESYINDKFIEISTLLMEAKRKGIVPDSLKELDGIEKFGHVYGEHGNCLRILNRQVRYIPAWERGDAYLTYWMFSYMGKVVFKLKEERIFMENI